MADHHIKELFERGCRRLLCELDRDRHSPTFGCFDRRYWGWKIVDYPEATYQRNAMTLAKMLPGCDEEETAVLTSAIRAALLYAAKIQHPDGSFDQAFPHEHSFGATAFLAEPLFEAYEAVREALSPDETVTVEQCLKNALAFLCRYDETHGLIANHLAGAALALLKLGRYFDHREAVTAARRFLSRVLDSQSREGWYVEYEGADPGYQTLCLHYLAQYYRLEPDDRLKQSLGRAFDFIQWFVHPDGTFGGEYGSRRTAVFYPGGTALLSGEFPVAAAIWNRMRNALESGQTVTPDRVDIGNLAPLLSSWLLAAGNWKDQFENLPELPCQKNSATADFPGCGIYVRNRDGKYVVCGTANGGVIKAFDRDSGKMLFNDGGYVGGLHNGGKITTQLTLLNRKVSATESGIEFEAPFFVMPDAVPTPFKFLLLRMLNLTLMRNIGLGNLVKSLLVKMLISGKRRVPLVLTRKLRWRDDGVVEMEDALFVTGRIKLDFLQTGVPFCGIHMASAKYFDNFGTATDAPVAVDTVKLCTDKEIRVKVEF